MTMFNCKPWLGVTIETRCYKLDMTWSLQPTHYKLATIHPLQTHYKWPLQSCHNPVTTNCYNLVTTTWPLQTCHNLATTILPQPGHYELPQLGHYNLATTKTQ